MKKIKITMNKNSFIAELKDTPTAKAIINKLPFEGISIRWGDEIYFSIPVSASIETNARDILEVGEIAYYPPMSAFCIFFGPTPASTDIRPRAADLVNVIGKITSEISPLNNVSNNEKIYVELVN